MTMVMMTGLAMTRERERGTMENLLATPVRPVEVMLGKILPYIVHRLHPGRVILAAALLLFDVPMVGSFALLMADRLVFIAANLAVGITFSTLAQNQLQAMQMTFFFFLPSILLSGFMFPVPRHAGMGAVARRGAAAHAFPAHRPRHPAQGQRRRTMCRASCGRSRCSCWWRARWRGEVPADAGLTLSASGAMPSLR